MERARKLANRAILKRLVSQSKQQPAIVQILKVLHFLVIPERRPMYKYNHW
ncbi:hypothetical protein OROHE_009224 [Orobanche hederae]